MRLICYSDIIKLLADKVVGTVSTHQAVTEYLGWFQKKPARAFCRSGQIIMCLMVVRSGRSVSQES